MGTFIARTRKPQSKNKVVNHDGWITMNGQHVLINDSTGIMMTGPLKGQKHKAYSEDKKKKSSIGAKKKGDSISKGFDKDGNIVSNVGETNDKQKVQGKVVSNKNLHEIDTPAGPHQIADGTDISEMVEIDANARFNAFEQIAYQQGFKNPPQTITDKNTFDDMVSQSNFVGFRTVNSYEGTTGKEFIESLKDYDANVFVFNATGGTAHGMGMYLASNNSIKGQRATDLDARDEAQFESWEYSNLKTGSTECVMTLQPSARLISQDQAMNNFYSADKATQERYDKMCTDTGIKVKNAWSLYAVAQGYDGVQWDLEYKDVAYTVIYNVSKLVVFDQNIEELH